MRTEQEMMRMILTIAESDERIRAVYMNGSRANPNAPKDDYRDYDIVYVVTETTSFIENKNWILNFGKPIITQEPCSTENNHDCSRFYNWLMLFNDGNRIDLSIETKEETAKNYSEDTLTVSLLDKDGILPKIPPSNDSGYWIKPPSEKVYYSCCNEFWWCLNNVVKGIVRKQLPYTMRMYTEVVHTQLDSMVEWYIGINNDFSVNTGQWGKYFEKYLSPELYERYVKTFSDGDYEHLQAAVLSACDLFHDLALMVAEHFGFTYRQDEEDGIREYFRIIKLL